MAIDRFAEDQYDRWLQTEFAAGLAHRLVASSQEKTHKVRMEEAEMVSKCHAEKVFARFLWIADPWRANKSLHTYTDRSVKFMMKRDLVARR